MNPTNTAALKTELSKLLSEMGFVKREDVIQLLNNQKCTCNNNDSNAESTKECLWEVDGVFLISPHNPLHSCVTDSCDYRYTYCPDCGKKIKLIERK